MNPLKQLIVFSCLMTCAISHGQATANSRVKKAVKTPAPNPPLEAPADASSSEIAFELRMIEGDYIRAKYRKMLVSEVVGAIEKVVGEKKGEFESASDFQARQRARLSSKFIEGAGTDDTFAFSLPVKRAGRAKKGVTYEYDADSRQVKLFILPQAFRPKESESGRLSLSDRKELDVFEFESKTTSFRNYQAGNAYGATVSASRSSYNDYGLAFERIPYLNFKRANEYFDPSATATFSLESTKAAKELPNLQALLVVKIVAPYLISDYFHSAATFNDPTDVTVFSRYLISNLLGVIVYSGTTGEVFLRFPELFGKAAEEKPAN